jgi:hypothetical protein
MGLKKFFKKNLRDIATVVGFAIGGPAGAAIGQGVGSVGEGRSLKKSLTSAVKVYGGASVATGAGLQGGGGKIGFGPAAPGTQGGIGGFFQDVGAGGRNLIGGGINPATGKKYTFADTFGKTSQLAKSYGDLGFMGKAGVIGTGLAGLGAFDPMEQPKNQMPGPMGGQYLTRGLTPATLSNAYSTAGIPVGLPGGGNALASSFAAYDPINQAYANLLDQGYGDLAFPEFQQQPIGAKFGGGIAKLMDGGELPQMDLREHGGDINDPEGSGDEDTVPALLADGEFVMTKQAVTGIGNGNHDTGIANLYAMMDKNENKAQSMGIGRA